MRLQGKIALVTAAGQGCAAALEAERYLADDHPRSWNPIAATKHLTTVYRPYPVVGMITPWNYPFLMPGIDGAAALAAGAAVDEVFVDSEAWAAADKLIALAGQGQAVVVVAHGFFNVMIERSLIARGWTRTLHQGGFRYWSARHFQKL